MKECYFKIMAMETACPDLFGLIENCAKKNRLLHLTAVLAITTNIMEGVNHMHQTGLAHHHLKSQNILITRYPHRVQIKSRFLAEVTDFGFTKACHDQSTG